MTLPRALQAQVDEAARVQQGLLAQGAEPTEESAEEPEEAQATEPVQAAPVAQPDPEEATWKQRYVSFKGMADAELARMNQAVRESQVQLGRMQAELEALRAQPKPEANTPAVSSQDVEQFGQDLIDLQSRVAKEAVRDAKKEWAAEKSELISQIEQLKGYIQNVGQSVGQSASDRFWERLAQTVPDWEATNQDPRFLAWLTEVEPTVGMNRQSLLDAAAKALDVGRVAAIFAAFKGITQAPAQAPQPKAQPPVSPNKASGKAAPAPNTPETRTYTHAEVMRLYTNQATGRRAYPPDQWAKIEADIQRAAHEGRITER